MDIFPSFKSFQEPSKDDHGAFTIDSRDIEEMKKPIPTNPVQKPNKSKRNNAGFNDAGGCLQNQENERTQKLYPGLSCRKTPNITKRLQQNRIRLHPNYYQPAGSHCQSFGS